MAQKVQTLLIDDLDGGDAESTVRFGLDGTRLRDRPQCQARRRPSKGPGTIPRRHTPSIRLLDPPPNPETRARPPSTDPTTTVRE